MISGVTGSQVRVKWSGSLIDWCVISSNADIVLNHYGQEGPEPEGKALHLNLYISSNLGTR